VIRNAVIHLANEQPLLADLFAPPGAADISLVCTNLRGMNGKRPVFADHDDSLFVFPYTHIRFVEVPAAALAAADAWLPAPTGSTEANGSNGKHGRKRSNVTPAGGDPAAAIVAGMAAAAPPASAPDAPADAPTEAAAPEAPVDDLDQELELDEDFLRRVREL
jgi:hypothetical protein